MKQADTLLATQTKLLLSSPPDQATKTSSALTVSGINAALTARDFQMPFHNSGIENLLAAPPITGPLW